MTKTVSLPDMIYADLVSVSGDLTSMAKKPFSLGMTVFLLTRLFQGFKAQPYFRSGLRKMLSELPIASPEEFDKMWNEYSQQILGGK